jgi:hypothetical protein
LLSTNQTVDQWTASIAWKNAAHKKWGHSGPGADEQNEGMDSSNGFINVLGLVTKELPILLIAVNKQDS